MRGEDFQDTAQVCPNGHVANKSSVSYPEFNKDFCEHCGEETITKCPVCSNPIRGLYHVAAALGLTSYTPPAYCRDCGAAFPWTDRKIAAAAELAGEIGGLSTQEVAEFEEGLQEISRESPRAQLGAARVQKALAKMSATTAQAVRDVIVDIVSETAKKIIWPGP